MEHLFQKIILVVLCVACVALLAAGLLHPRTFLVTIADKGGDAAQALLGMTSTSENPAANALAPLDIPAYNAKLLALANIPPMPVRATTSTTSTRATATGTKSGIAQTTSTIPIPVAISAIAKLWPVKAPYPDPGAILPFKRIVAYYGNLYSTQMGVLGEYPAPQMLQMLQDQAAQWAAADPTTPVVPALDYIAVSAQASPGADGKYRARMPASQIDEILQLASQVNGIVILDVQVGLSNVQTEVPLLEPFLKLPQVELALDPEFAMHDGERPGTVIGTLDASDINWAAQYLANIVRTNNLPPKILVIHRFTNDMVTNYQEITPLPEVQIVMDMDGFGSPAKKIGTYYRVIEPDPVQFTGFKLFYKNDANATSSHLMTPQEVLKLSPQPSFIQYQ